jgi:hypothetical protein
MLCIQWFYDKKLSPQYPLVLTLNTVASIFYHESQASLAATTTGKLLRLDLMRLERRYRVFRGIRQLDIVGCGPLDFPHGMAEIRFLIFPAAAIAYLMLAFMQLGVGPRDRPATPTVKQATLFPTELTEFEFTRSVILGAWD